MSNLERRPTPHVCTSGVAVPAVQIVTPREVPLGGPRSMTVRRTLPSKQRSFVGAWCFVDHYGPDDVSATGGMDVPPHPHTGLSTVSWLFEGEIRHDDSGGVTATVRPGELNLMTAGAGIAHAEVSTEDTTVLHGVQLWVALPASAAHGPRDFVHHAPAWEHDGDVRYRAFVGSLAGSRSPVPTATPLVGAEVELPAGMTWTVAVDPAHEHGVLVDTGGGPGEAGVRVAGVTVARGELGCVEAGADSLTMANTGSGPARLLLLGGEPFGEEIVMWWNFVGRSTDEIADFRQEWQSAGARFGHVPGYPGQRLPAPPMPPVRLRPRGNRRRQSETGS